MIYYQVIKKHFHANSVKNSFVMKLQIPVQENIRKCTSFRCWLQCLVKFPRWIIRPFISHSLWISHYLTSTSSPVDAFFIWLLYSFHTLVSTRSIRDCIALIDLSPLAFYKKCVGLWINVFIMGYVTFSLGAMTYKNSQKGVGKRPFALRGMWHRFHENESYMILPSKND